MILDVIVIGLIVLAFIISAKKGLVKSVWKIAALILTIVLVMAFKEPATQYLLQTKLYNTVNNAVCQRLKNEIEGSAESEILVAPEEDKMSIPQYIINDITDSVETEMYNGINTGTDIISTKLTQWSIQIIAVIGLFISIRLLLMAAFTVINAIVKLPLINQANALLGGLLGAVNMLALIYIACALLSLFTESEIVGLINQSNLVKYFYNNNILLQLII